MKKPVVNGETCIACGTCPSLCPATFAIKTTHAEVINPTGNSESEIDTAIASCPTQSISWVEE